jgi:ribosomal protein S14
MSFINSRLRRLEETIRGARRCPECGLSAGDPEARRIVTTYEDDENAVEEALAECCEECGRPEVLHLRVVYDR